MRVDKIQNNAYIPQFNGMIKIQNFAKNGEITKIETTQEFDKGFAELALKNLFDGDWANSGNKKIELKKLKQYFDVNRQTLGLRVPKISRDQTEIELKHFDKGYSIKSENNYIITHIREDQLVW